MLLEALLISTYSPVLCSPPLMPYYSISICPYANLLDQGWPYRAASLLQPALWSQRRATSVPWRPTPATRRRRHGTRALDVSSSPDIRARSSTLIRLLAQELRDKPTLPANRQRPEAPCDGYDEAVALPAKHCAFRSCAWHGSDNEELVNHWMTVHSGAGTPLQQACSFMKADGDISEVVWSVMCEAIAV